MDESKNVDIQKVIEKAREFIYGEGFTEIGTKKGIKLEKKEWKDSNFAAYKGTQLEYFKGSAEEMAKELYHKPFEWWHSFDSNLLRYEKVSDISESAQIQYMLQHLPWPISDRDFVSLFCFSHFESFSIVIWQSVEHPDFPDPASSSIVRGITTFGGFLFEKDPSRPSSHCRIIRFMHVDPKGSIPNWLVSSTVDSELVDMVLAVQTLAPGQ